MRGKLLSGRPFLAVVALLAMSAVAPGDATAQSGGVLVVGDSLEVGTGPYLRRELGSTGLTIDARKGRPSAEGVRVLAEELRPGHRVVVFDLGVNDHPSQQAALGRNLAAVRELVGDRCLVVATLSRRPLKGVSIEGMNRVIRAFVADTPRARLFDWRAATQSDPGLLGRDRLHSGGAGYAVRARLLAATIAECSSPADPLADPPDSASPTKRTPKEPAEPRTPPKRSRQVKEDPAWVSWVAAVRQGPLVAFVQNEIDRVDVAAREAVGAVSPPAPEPKLGAPSERPVRRGASARP